MKRRTVLVITLLVLLGISMFSQPSQAQAEPGGQAVITGRILDPQGQSIRGAQVTLTASGVAEPLARAESQADGRYALLLPEFFPAQATINIQRTHFHSQQIQLDQAQLFRLQDGQSLALPNLTLERHITAAFWLAAILFVLVLALIANSQVHNTLAALVGASALLAISYLGPLLHPSLFIFDFQHALSYVDWNVVFLIMGMMIVIAIIEHTGIFQWLAYRAFKLSGGRPWLLLPILMLITGLASAFLDNVTTMLLMTPISVQIALALDLNPLALLIPEVMASNILGISTLVGTPTNILIGSYGQISFTDFLSNLTPGVLVALLGVALYSEWIYRKDLFGAGRHTSTAMLEKLGERAKITQPKNLKKTGWVGLGMLSLFIFGEHIHLLPAVTALIGATVLLAWIQPDIEAMIEAVDWTTLVFFITLFMVVGAVQEVGLIGYLAGMIGKLVGKNLVLAMIAVTWLSAVLSTVIANIPFTAAMLPVIGFLTATIPGAESKVLFYCLSVGSAMGGNGSLIGASANMVTAGIAERAGYPITYAYFLKKGFPALAISVGLATIWLLIKF